MAVDSRHQPQLAGIPYDQLRYAPQFTNPWVTSAPVSGQVYASSQPPTTLDTSSQLQQRQNLTLPPYQGLPITTTALPHGSSLQTASYGNSTGLQQQYGQYPTSTSTGYQPSAPTGYTLELPSNRATGFAYPQDPARRPSHPFNGASQDQRNSFSEAVDASRAGLISLNQSDITPTPRNMYGTDQSQRNGSPDSYGFPATHSAHSSISNASGMHSSYGSSVGDYSLTDYSSASESVDMNHRTLPPPSTLGNSVPPAPQSMMGQFSSKVSSSSQKKHKCKVCDKRFTRPSSLQTHMYSHTGEKPFACDVEGCGRHFSVVSNLRRHKKVHKNDASSVTTNEED
jgi:hypothetical protein